MRSRTVAGAAALVALIAPDARAQDATAEETFLLAQPFASPRNSFFYSGLGQPLLRPSRTVPGTTLRLRTSQTESAHSGDDLGQPNRFDGLYREYARVEVAHGATDRIEIFAHTRFGGWDERRDVFRVFTGASLEGPDFPSVQGERAKILLGRSTSRHENLIDATLGGKVELARGFDGLSGFALSAQCKLPVARSRDISSSGTIDAAFTGHLTLTLGALAVHVNAGVVLPFGDERIFAEDPQRVRPFGHWAAGLTAPLAKWLAIGASVEGSGRAWRGVPLLDHAPVVGTVGVRVGSGDAVLEVAVGRRLVHAAADSTLWVELATRF